MDANLFYVANLTIFGALILGATQRNDLLKIALPFFFALFGIFVMVQVNTDGGLTQIAGSTPSVQTVATTWPTLYLTLFGVLLNFGMTFYNGVKGR